MELKSPEVWMREKVYGYWLSQALYCAAQLNLADIIFRDGPQTTSDLAKKTSTHERSLYRLMRYLASEEVFAEDENGLFILTPRANQLRSDIPGSQYAMAVMSGSEHYLASSHMIDNVRTGKCAYEIAHGAPIFDYLKNHPASARIFDKAMESIHGSESRQILDSYDFSSFKTVADIGGAMAACSWQFSTSIPWCKAFFLIYRMLPLPHLKTDRWIAAGLSLGIFLRKSQYMLMPTCSGISSMTGMMKKVC